MADPQDILRVIGAVEASIPIVAGLVRDLKSLVTDSGSISADDILAEADANWAAVIAVAKKELNK